MLKYIWSICFRKRKNKQRRSTDHKNKRRRRRKDKSNDSQAMNDEQVCVDECDNTPVPEEISCEEDHTADTSLDPETNVKQIRNTPNLPCQFCGKRSKHNLKQHLLKYHRKDLGLTSDSQENNEILREELLEAKKNFFNGTSVLPFSLAERVFTDVDFTKDEVMVKKVKWFASKVGVKLQSQSVVRMEEEEEEDNESDKIRVILTKKGLDEKYLDDNKYISGWKNDQIVFTGVAEQSVSNYESLVRRCLFAIAKRRNEDIGESLIPFLTDTYSLRQYIQDLLETGVSILILYSIFYHILTLCTFLIICFFHFR